MTLLKKINDWKKYPNALGSEAQVSVLVGELAAILKKEIPEPVKSALKTLALRGTMRDIASAIGSNIEQRNLRVPSFHEVVDNGAASCGISWTEAVAVLAQYVTECGALLPPAENIPINEEGSHMNEHCECNVPVNNHWRGEFCRCCGNSIVRELGIKYCHLQKPCQFCERTTCGQHSVDGNGRGPVRRFCEICRERCNGAGNCPVHGLQEA